MDAAFLQQLAVDGGMLGGILYMLLRNTRTTYNTIPRITKAFTESLKEQIERSDLAMAKQAERHQRAMQDQRHDFKEELKAEREQTNKVISRIPKTPY